MNGKDPLGYPLEHYLWVILIACIGGIIRYLNSAKKFALGKAVVDTFTAGFTGVLTFWVCEAIGIRGPMSAILIATGGMMGNRATKEFENIWRTKMGVAASQDKPKEDKE